ncbi:hypothetical protein H5079_17905 [Pseudoalteromonas sp. SG44-5]|uniref:portal protein n=1 Tax=Pseudoalteromonas sp. SG44-5 TaxID=2760960 RepID=UPI0015FD2D43|nr:portal protein [Pseudoalteromonas sp. SG44-5]MBB1407476.1 hypothetical protein [Pseudoalteromonas sp. SG44-5]
MSRNKSTDPKMVARDNQTRFEEANSAKHTAFIKRAVRNNNFYAGEQWDKDDKARLDREGRPALTLNMILSTVNAIIGEQLERKVEVVYRPRDYGDENTAYALNAITRSILAATHFDDTEEDVFADGIIAGRGYYDVRMSFEKNLQGEVVITSEDPIDVIPDSEAKSADPATWNEVFISRWLTLDEIGAEYGWEKVEGLERLIDVSSYNTDDNFEFYGNTFGGTDRGSHNDEKDSRELRRVRVIERQHYRVDEQYHFVDMATGNMRPVGFGVDKEEREAFANEYGLELIKRKGRRVRMTTTADDIVLRDDWSLYRSFTIVPFFPYFRRGNPFGPVDNLIDPQNLLNKTSSQELHIVNTTANSGWVLQEDSLVDMDAEELEERGAETGLVLQYKRGYEKPDKIQPNQIPTGIDRISQKAAATIREISSVNASMLGTARADQSGRAQEAAIGRGQIQVSVIVSNLKRARKMVGRKILELVQDFYSETRYFKTTGNSIMQGEERTDEVGINVPADDGSILNDVTIGDYSVEASFRPSGGTMADQEFEEALRLREMGVAIPDHVIVQHSNLTKRAELAEFLKNSQGFGEPTEEQAALEEMQVEHQINMLRKELEKVDADIEVALATAKEKMAKADSLAGFNQAQMELQRLEQERQIKEQELSLRIALAARSHQNQNGLNDKRISSQIAMKSMDMAYNAQNSNNSNTNKNNNKGN